MNLTNFFSQGLNFASTSSPEIAIVLFLACLVGEGIGISVPYLLETIWLMAGYRFSVGILPFRDLIFSVLMAQGGRQVGSLVLYHLSVSGSSLIEKHKRRLKLETDLSEATPLKIFRKVDFLSPFSVALGRLLWLRIPLTLILGAKRKLKVLLLSVVLSSLVYDGAYIIIGMVVGTTTTLEPTHMILYFLAGLTVIYMVTFVIRRLVYRLTKRRRLRALHMPTKSQMSERTAG